jgi:hypothetical protein
LTAARAFQRVIVLDYRKISDGMADLKGAATSEDLRPMLQVTLQFIIAEKVVNERNVPISFKLGVGSRDSSGRLPEHRNQNAAQQDDRSHPLLYTEAWKELLKTSYVKSVRILESKPNCNPYAEGFVRTIQTACLDHFAIIGERHLRVLVRKFYRHCNCERFHQGFGGRLLTKPVNPKTATLTQARSSVALASAGYSTFVTERLHDGSVQVSGDYGQEAPDFIR